MKKMKLTLANVIVAGSYYKSKLQEIKISLHDRFEALRPPFGQDLPFRFYACRNINTQAQLSGNILLKRLS